MPTNDDSLSPWQLAVVLLYAAFLVGVAAWCVVVAVRIQLRRRARRHEPRGFEVGTAASEQAHK